MRGVFCFLTFFCFGLVLAAKDFNDVPVSWKWLSENKLAFSYDGSFTDSLAFALTLNDFKKHYGLKDASLVRRSPIRTKDVQNVTYSPDGKRIAYIYENNLFVKDVVTGEILQVTEDGSDVILNGRASWVYYEEILGRASDYKAFWWSPDSQRIVFYRFDNSDVPVFPIYSHKGQSGVLNMTRYPKCGQNNPAVNVGIVDVLSGKLLWVDFDEEGEKYFGTPFWSNDSKRVFVSRQPREQNVLDVYAVSAVNAAKVKIYNEEYKTWLNWIEGMLFADDGLYMVREFETGWQQIYFLSYDGKRCERLTSGENWRVELLRVDEKSGDVFFLAERDSRVRRAVYRLAKDGKVKALTDRKLNASGVAFSPNGRYFVTALSGFETPLQLWVYDLQKFTRRKVADMKRGKVFDKSKYTLPKHLTMKTKDGLELPGYIVFPERFDERKKYPVHVDIYGGPDTPLVKERWLDRSANVFWYAQHGIIAVVADCRAAGHNGREGLDAIYGQLGMVETRDFVEWAEYLKSLPYVDGDKIGVEGFSFGGTMVASLLINHSDAYHYGIAGGGVYDWALYDTHYTERFMNTPQNNEEGYKNTRVASQVKNYPVSYEEDFGGKVMLRLTHGTGDDNVHFQNTLLLVDELQKNGKKFELMIYPDGMHGYRGLQGEHALKANREFWLKNLKNRKH